MRILVCIHRWDMVARDDTDICGRASHLWNQHIDGRATSAGREVWAWYGHTFRTSRWIALLHSERTAVLSSDHLRHWQRGCCSSRVYCWWIHWLVSSSRLWIGSVWRPQVDPAETYRNDWLQHVSGHIQLDVYHDAKIWLHIRKLPRSNPVDLEVFSAFNFNRFLPIHDSIHLTHIANCWTADAASVAETLM